MDISLLFIRILFLTLPGILSNRLYRTLKGIPSQKDWEDLVDIVIFSLLSYGAYGLIYLILQRFGYSIHELTVLLAATDDKKPLAWSEISWACLIGIILAFIAAYVEKVRLINRIGQLLGASARFGHGDLWNNFHTNFGKTWSFVRDHKLNLTYYGAIIAYSDAVYSKERELIMEEVDVYSNISGAFLYTIQKLYVSRESHDLTIEVPAQRGITNVHND